MPEIPDTSSTWSHCIGLPRSILLPLPRTSSVTPSFSAHSTTWRSSLASRGLIVPLMTVFAVFAVFLQPPVFARQVLVPSTNTSSKNGERPTAKGDSNSSRRTCPHYTRSARRETLLRRSQRYPLAQKAPNSG